MEQKNNFLTALLYLAKEFAIPGRKKEKLKKPSACIVVFGNKSGMLPDIWAIADAYGLHLPHQPFVSINKTPADTYVYEFNTEKADMAKATVVTKKARLSEKIPPITVHCQGQPSKKVAVHRILTISGTKLQRHEKTIFEYPRHMINVTYKGQLIPTLEAVGKATHLKAHNRTEYNLIFAKDNHCVYVYDGLKKDHAEGVILT